jgi:Fe-S cluster biosynthesis and repair protein YggX
MRPPHDEAERAAWAEGGGIHGMAQVQCVRCNTLGEAIAEPLYQGKLESYLKSNICAPCWGEWVKMRVMVINEYQVNLGDESGRALVKDQMFAFLKLPKPDQPQPS